MIASHAKPATVGDVGAALNNQGTPVATCADVTVRLLLSSE